MGRFRSVLNSVRENHWVASAAVPLATLIRNAAHRVDVEICKKVKVNGRLVTYDGIELRFPRNVGVGFASNIHWHGSEGFEPDTWRVLRSFLPTAAHFIDVGSNIGFYAVLAKLLNPTIVVDGFEPVPAILEKNRAFHRANGLDDSRVRAIALSDHDGKGTLFLPESQSSRDEEMTGTVRGDSWQARKANSQIPVILRTLDSFATDVSISTPTLMKIDVEDYEAAVFQGGRKTIEALRPVIVVEILPRKHGNEETWERIARLRYRAFAITSSGLFRFSEYDFRQDRRFTDFLLLPEERIRCASGYIAFDSVASAVALA